MNAISRAQFLRGDWHGNHPELRPPWAVAESLYVETCDGCGECTSACQQNILQLSRGLAVIRFSEGECTFCGDCALSCPTGALTRPTPDLDGHHPEAWGYLASINNNCLARNGTSCAACIDGCGHQAVVSRPVIGGRSEIEVDQNRCNGCGACVAACPVRAIEMNC